MHYSQTSGFHSQTFDDDMLVIPEPESSLHAGPQQHLRQHRVKDARPREPASTRPRGVCTTAGTALQELLAGAGAPVLGRCKQGLG